MFSQLFETLEVSFYFFQNFELHGAWDPKIHSLPTICMCLVASRKPRVATWSIADWVAHECLTSLSTLGILSHLNFNMHGMCFPCCCLVIPAWNQSKTDITTFKNSLAVYVHNMPIGLHGGSEGVRLAGGADTLICDLRSKYDIYSVASPRCMWVGTLLSKCRLNLQASQDEICRPLWIPTQSL